MSWLGFTPALGLALTVAAALNLVACDRDAGPVLAAAAPATVSAGPATPGGGAPDTSVPDAASTFAAQDATERAKALQDAAAALNKTGPPTTMSKEQESKTMPLPGQANDHSTAGRDDKRKEPRVP